jgi:hypothetical protein
MMTTTLTSNSSSSSRMHAALVLLAVAVLVAAAVAAMVRHSKLLVAQHQRYTFEYHTQVQLDDASFRFIDSVYAHKALRHVLELYARYATLLCAGVDLAEIA